MKGLHTKWWEAVEQLEPLHTVRMQNGTATFENHLATFEKFSVYLM